MSLRTMRLGNPLESDYETYVEDVRTKNAALLQETKGVICQLPWVEELEEAARGEDLKETRVHIATTGSDGRLEKKGDKTSPIGALVIIERLGTINGMTQDVRSRCQDVIRDFGFFGLVEIKDLARDKISYSQAYATPQSWPTIMIDAHAVCKKNEDLLLRGREKMAREAGEGKSGARIIQGVQSRLREYKKLPTRERGRSRATR